MSSITPSSRVVSAAPTREVRLPIWAISALLVADLISVMVAPWPFVKLMWLAILLVALAGMGWDTITWFRFMATIKTPSRTDSYQLPLALFAPSLRPWVVIVAALGATWTVVMPTVACFRVDWLFGAGFTLMYAAALFGIYSVLHHKKWL